MRTTVGRQQWKNFSSRSFGIISTNSGRISDAGHHGCLSRYGRNGWKTFWLSHSRLRFTTTITTTTTRTISDSVIATSVARNQWRPLFALKFHHHHQPAWQSLSRIKKPITTIARWNTTSTSGSLNDPVTSVDQATTTTTTTTPGTYKTVLPPFHRHEHLHVDEGNHFPIFAWQHKDDGGRILYLLGISHGDKNSSDAAVHLIRTVRPKAVMVELDLNRLYDLGTSRIQLPLPDSSNTIAKNSSSRSNNRRSSSSSSNNDSKRKCTTTLGFKSTNDNEFYTVKQSVTWYHPEGDHEEKSIWQRIMAKSIPGPTNFHRQVLSFHKRPDKNPTVTTATSSSSSSSFRTKDTALSNDGLPVYDKKRFKNGDEFVEAMRYGQMVGAVLVLGDVPDTLQMTFGRYYHGVLFRWTDYWRDWIPTWNKIRALWDLVWLVRRLLRREDEYQLKQRLAAGLTLAEAKRLPTVIGDNLAPLGDTPQETFDFYRQYSWIREQLVPHRARTDVHERNLYMVSCLNALKEFPTIVAVVGVGHFDGVGKLLHESGWRLLLPPEGEK